MELLTHRIYFDFGVQTNNFEPQLWTITAKSLNIISTSLQYICFVHNFVSDFGSNEKDMNH